VVSDIREEATARHGEHGAVAASPADLARAADVVVVAVVNDEQVTPSCPVPTAPWRLPDRAPRS